jgi:hypothetical protein
MVVASLSLGGLVGVVLSGGFLWWEVGRYAAPQVPVTVFDERKVLAAYTVGLFVGVPLAAAYVLLTAAFANAALLGAGILLGGIVAGTEAAQLLLVRSAYWGSSVAVPFYAVSLRAGVGGILGLAAVASYLGGVRSPTVVGLSAALLAAGALLALEVAGGLLSLRSRSGSTRAAGGPWVGGLFGVVAFVLLGLGPAAGPVGSIVAPLVVLLGSVLAYRGRRGALDEVPPPSAAGSALPSEHPFAYGRTPPPSSRP